MGVTFPQLRDANLGRNSEQHWMRLENWGHDDWLTGLGGEVGEALNVVKKLNRERDGLTGNRENCAQLLDMLAAELADAVIYADLLAARFGVVIDDRSFAEFREYSRLDLRRQIGRQSVGRTCTALLRVLGRLADIVEQEGLARPLSVPPTLAVSLVLRELDILALHFDIDLGAAVATKFNATSEKLGFPQRLEVA